MQDIDSFQILSAPRRPWGSGVGVFQLQNFINAHYFSESLPAIFERTLVFDRLHLAGESLDWVFTGPRAGIMISLSESALRVRQYFYDSFGLQFDVPHSGDFEEAAGQRCPWRIAADSSVPLLTQPSSLTVILDDRLHLAVSAGPDVLVRQQCLFDVTQHQIRLSKDCRAAGRLCGPSVRSVSLDIQPASTAQTILGFGGITSIPAYRMLSAEGRAQWWELIREYNLLIQREYPPGTTLLPDCSNWDDPGAALPHSYGDNFPNGEIVDFDYNRHVISLGGTTWFEFWLLPTWIKADQPSGHFCDTPGLDIPAFCRTVIDYCRRSLERAGAPPGMVGVQNERCQSVAALAGLVPALRKALDEAGFSSVRIHMSNASNLQRGVDFLDRFMQDEEVWSRTDYTSSNLYDAQDRFLEGMDGYGEELHAFYEKSGRRSAIAPELCINRQRFQLDSYRLAFCMAGLYHQCLTRMQAEALCYCWLLLHTPQPSFAWTRSLCMVDVTHGGVPCASSHQLRAFGAFSRKLPAGFQRVECLSGHSGLLASAYISPPSGFTAILLNRSTSPMEVALEGPAHLQAEICSIYEQNSPAPHKIKSAVPGSWIVSIAPGEIVTLFSRR